MISSTTNPQVKNVVALTKKSKARADQMLFVVEGPKMFAELPKERIERVYVSEGFLKQETAPGLLMGCRYETVSDDVFQHMSDTQTPQGIMALVRQYHYSVEDIIALGKPAHLMMLENIQDPGNLGTILRSGEGAGITGVIMSENTADIYNPKVIRSTMGSIYRVPFAYASDLGEAMKKVKAAGIQIYAAHLEGKNNYDQEVYTDPVTFLIGNESRGLSEEATLLADTLIKIPMLGQVESLNAGVASALLMFETARQRRDKS